MLTFATFGDWLNGNFIGIGLGACLMIVANLFGFRAPAYLRKKK